MSTNTLPAKLAKTSITNPALRKPKPKAKAKSLSAKSLSAKKCQGIITRLMAMGDLPSNLQLLLKRLARGLASNGKYHINEQAGVSILAKAVQGVEKALDTQFREAQAVLEGAEEEREARAAAQAAAEANVGLLKQALLEKRAALTGSLKTIDERKAAVSAVRSAQKSVEAGVKGRESRKRQLETVERESFEPLREESAAGPDGKKRLATLRKFGRDHGFHKELLAVLPAVLRKMPDKRRTFDGLCMQQLEVEFARQTAKLETAVEDAEMQTAKHAEELETAQGALQEARDQRKALTKEVTAAEGALEGGKKAVLEARRQFRRLPADMKLAEKRLLVAQSRIEKFRKGPLAMYQSYETSLPSSRSEPVVRNSPADVEDVVSAPPAPPARKPVEETEVVDHSTEEEWEEEEDPDDLDMPEG